MGKLIFKLKTQLESPNKSRFPQSPCHQPSLAKELLCETRAGHALLCTRSCIHHGQILSSICCSRPEVLLLTDSFLHAMCASHYPQVIVNILGQRPGLVLWFVCLVFLRRWVEALCLVLQRHRHELCSWAFVLYGAGQSPQPAMAHYHTPVPWCSPNQCQSEKQCLSFSLSVTS